MSNALRTINCDESYRLLQAVRSDKLMGCSPKVCCRNYCIILCMLDAGLRVAEVAHLRVSDLWYGGHPVLEIVVRNEIAKGNRERTVPTTDRLQTAIGEMYSNYWGSAEMLIKPFAFYIHDCTKHIQVRHVQRIVALASARGINRAITPHVLRHTFATRMMRVTNLRVVQKLLGHKSLSSTQVYTHPNSEDLRDAVKQMPM